ncbi:hypothetical protein PYCCODRAFT_268343 [Trametes coccinea BRFM310]|uniref:Uncharacterized protein n=1 Tax=Trametes coccinea (strain BRFM310) TaxID=1353009 RepID=A0A1Y2IT51_TRAC3|nr:hypothetical protein PYCCODRAFT_268343 [Trametes coccinea BRFM310]
METKENGSKGLGELPMPASPTKSSDPEAVIRTDLNSEPLVKIETDAGRPSEERLLDGNPLPPSPTTTSSQPSRAARIVDEAHGTKEHAGHVISGTDMPALSFEATDERTAPAAPALPSAKHDVDSLDGLAFYPTPEPSERVDTVPTPPEEQPSAACPVERSPSIGRATASRPESITPPSSPALNEAAALPSVQVTSRLDNAVDAAHIPDPPSADCNPPDTRAGSAVYHTDTDSAHSSPKPHPRRAFATAEELPGPFTIWNASYSVEPANTVVDAPSPKPPASNGVMNREAALSSARSSIESHLSSLGSVSREALAVSARGARASSKGEAGAGSDSPHAAGNVPTTRPVITADSKITTPASSQVAASKQLLSLNAASGTEIVSASEPPPPPYRAASVPGPQGTRIASSSRGHNGGRALPRAPSPQHPHTTEPQGSGFRRGVEHGLHKPSEIVLHPLRGSFSDPSQARPTTSSPDAAVPTQVNGTTQSGRRTSSQFWLKVVLTCVCIRGEGHYIAEEHGD